MSSFIKVMAIVVMLLSSESCCAQYDYLSLRLSVSDPLWRDKNIEFELYRKDTSYWVTAKNVVKRIDTAIAISKSEFDVISQLALSISSSDVLKGMNPNELSIWTDAIGTVLEIKIPIGSIIYTVLTPSANTDKRYLRTYLQVCKEMILAAKMNPKHVLSR